MTDTTQRAAAAIVAMINSRPNTPSAAEIAALLGSVGAAPAPMSPALAALYQEWRSLIGGHLRQFGDGTEDGLSDEQMDEYEERMAEDLDRIWALVDRIHDTPAQTWGDILLFAEVTFWAHWTGIDPQRADANVYLAEGPWSTGGVCDDTLGKLIEAVFSVAGIGSPHP
jgi:hypothetical protein